MARDFSQFKRQLSTPGLEEFLREQMRLGKEVFTLTPKVEEDGAMTFEIHAKDSKASVGKFEISRNPKNYIKINVRNHE